MIDRAGYLMAGGRDVAVERVRGVNDNMRRSHYHQYFELYYLTTGVRFHIADDRLYELGEHDLIIFPPYVMHHSYGAADIGFDRIVLYFQPSMVLHSGVLKRIQSRESTYRVPGPRRRSIDAAMARLIAIQQRHEEFFEVELQVALNELLLGIVRTEPTDMAVAQRNRMTEVIRYLHDHHTEAIKLDDLAASFFISTPHLCREFKKFTSSTIVQYVNNVRIGRAQRLLLETEMAITDVSKEVGFANVTHFNRTFKAVTGMSPSESKRQPMNR